MIERVAGGEEKGDAWGTGDRVYGGVWFGFGSSSHDFGFEASGVERGNLEVLYGFCLHDCHASIGMVPLACLYSDA